MMLARHFLLSAMCLSIAAGCAGPQLAREQEKIPFVGAFEVNRYVYPNGLKLLIVEDHSSPTFAYQTWFNVGSRDEKEGATGLAHLFEHMMFKKTLNLSDGEFDRLLERAGAEDENAFTSRDYTAYVQELPKSELDLIARLEADRMVNLVVDEVAFKTETEVVQNERRYRNENSPDGQMYQALFEVAFKEHSYHWPVIGYQEDLDRMAAQDAVEFYKKNYSPGQATIVVVGDVNPSTVVKAVEKYYGKIPPQTADTVLRSAEPTQTEPRRKNLKLNTLVEKLYLAFRVPGFMSADTPKFEVLQALLTDAKSGRLQQSLVETGIASSVESGSFQNKDPSLFSVFVNLQKNKKTTQAEKIILQELSKLAQSEISHDELERAKNLVRFAYYDGLEGNAAKANLLGRMEAVAGRFEDGLSVIDRVATVTPQDIQQLADTYFKPETRTVITGVPK